jgi:hypothetical protein
MLLGVAIGDHEGEVRILALARIGKVYNLAPAHFARGDGLLLAVDDDNCCFALCGSLRHIDLLDFSVRIMSYWLGAGFLTTSQNTIQIRYNKLIRR